MTGAREDPVDELWHWEDFRPGEVIDLGEREVTGDEIVEFARRYDPQPFHVDETAAAQSLFGGLIASGWHTASLFMRLYADTVLSKSAGMGSPGVDELRWRHPVRPGDVLRGSLSVEATAPSASRPERGTVFLGCELRNQDDRPVLTMTVRGLFARRERITE
jgi:acyl dehydratase